MNLDEKLKDKLWDIFLLSYDWMCSSCNLSWCLENKKVYKIKTPYWEYSFCEEHIKILLWI
jgi:hypothetical protein